MNRVRTWWPCAVLLALGGGVVGTPTTRAADIGYIEDFALAKDRAAALKQLIPGTEDYYYFHCLHLLNSGQFEKIAALTAPWHERHGQTPRLTEIQIRAALLSYDKKPDQTLTFLRNHLGLTFDHQKETVDVAPNLPVALDPALIARARLQEFSLAITLRTRLSTGLPPTNSAGTNGGLSSRGFSGRTFRDSPSWWPTT
jgi:hypothetical protein